MTIECDKLQPQLFSVQHYVYDPQFSHKALHLHQKMELHFLAGLGLKPISRYEYFYRQGYELSRHAQLLSRHQAENFIIAGCRQCTDNVLLRDILSSAMKMPHDFAPLLHKPEVRAAVELVLNQH